MAFDYQKKPSTHVWFDVEQVHSTDDAVLLNFNGDEIWIPKKAMGGRKKDEDGKITKLELEKKFAKTKNLID